jgi:DNA polymerase
MAESAKKNLLKFWGIHLLPQELVPAETPAAKPVAPRPAPVARAKAPARPAEKLSVGQKQAQINELRKEVEERCPKCGLEKTRNYLVFGEGDPNADIVFVGEAPGFDEDRQGRPFVGKAGQLLTDIITKGMGLSREDIYICNVLKCRPPQNRPPTPEEINICNPYLVRQLQIIQPRVIVALGASAVRGLLPEITDGITRTRGQFYDYYMDGPGTQTGEVVKVMATFHPSYLLRNPAAKIYVWEDIKKVLAYLDIPLPTRKKTS